MRETDNGLTDKGLINGNLPHRYSFGSSRDLFPIVSGKEVLQNPQTGWVKGKLTSLLKDNETETPNWAK